MSLKLLGTVTSFDAKTKFGFIRPDGRIREIIVRAGTRIDARDLGSGDRVRVSFVHDERYIPVAVDIQRVPKAH